MSYIDYSYYSNVFAGGVIPESEFDFLASAASDVVDALVFKNIPKETPDCIKKATAYQAEMLFSHGSADALAGITVALGGFNEKIGDCSIGNNRLNTAGARIPSIGGIPVSGVTVAILRKNGYMNRLACNDGVYSEEEKA